MTNAVSAAHKRYEVLLAATQEAYDALAAQHARITQQMLEAKIRLEDTRLALDALTLALEKEKAAPVGNRPVALEKEKAAPVGNHPVVQATRRRLERLRSMSTLDAALLLAEQHNCREADTTAVVAWLKQAGYRNRQNRIPTPGAIHSALSRGHTLGTGKVTRMGRGVYRFNW